MEHSSTGPINLRVDGDTAKAALAGDFDMQATFTVEPALEGVVRDPVVSALEVDLSRLSFIDSTGIGVLLRLEADARERGIALSIVPAPPEVQRVFELTGVADVLPFGD